MPIFREHSYTSVTVKINQITESHRDDIDDSPEMFLKDLLELVNLQSSGPSEAARAIRKKIKYGSLDEQLRALQVLELLISNSGRKVGPVIARDDKLIDVLKGILNGSGKDGIGSSYPKEVSQQVQSMAIDWKHELEGLDGYKYFALLWQNIPKYKKSHSRTSSRHVSNSNSNVFDSFEDSETSRSQSPRISSPRVSSPRVKSPPPRPPASYKPEPSKADKKKSRKDRKRNKKSSKYADSEYKIPQINYKVEAPRIRNVIAETHTNTTALENLLLQLPLGESPLEDKKTAAAFEKCRSNRRKVLRYLQYVGAGGSDKPDDVIAMDEEFLGSLITANEKLVEAFKKFDQKSGYTEENPAPEYEDEEESESDESYYYTDSSEEEEEVPEVDAASARLQEISIGSSSASMMRKPPPPRPTKPPALRPAKPAALSSRPVLSKTDTNTSVSSDPFGDAKGAGKSVYD